MCSRRTWRVLLTLAHRIKQKGLRISFFNSTPQASQAGRDYVNTYALLLAGGNVEVGPSYGLY